MDKILNHICKIDKHPIKELDEVFIERYLKGLGAALYEISMNDPKCKILFFGWANSLDRNINSDNLDSYWTENRKSIIKALSLQRKKFSFFTMRKFLFYDLFYLCESSDIKFDTREVNEKIKSIIKGILSKKDLKILYNKYINNEKNIKGLENIIAHKSTRDKINRGKEFKILVVANISAGKSTLINSLIGYRINKTQTTICTNKIVHIHNKIREDGITIKKEDGTYDYSLNKENFNSDSFSESSLHFNSMLSGSQVCFIDTPGINNSEDPSHKAITESAIRKGDYDLVIYISNCKYFGTNDENHILMYLKKHSSKPIIFVLNQLDNFRQKEDSIKKMISDYKNDLEKIGFKNPEIAPVSARSGLLFKLDDSLIDDEDRDEKDFLNKKFQKEYYNLPSYVSEISAKGNLGYCGQIDLEYKILNYIK